MGWSGTVSMLAWRAWARVVARERLARVGPARWPIWLNQRKMLKNGAVGGIRTHALVEEGRDTLGEAV